MPPMASSPLLSFQLKSGDSATVIHRVSSRSLSVAASPPSAQLAAGKVRPPSVDQQMPFEVLAGVARSEKTATTKVSLG